MDRRKRPEHRGGTFGTSSTSRPAEGRYRKPPNKKESAPGKLDPKVKPKQQQYAAVKYVKVLDRSGHMQIVPVRDGSK